jgi:ribosome-binding protein aMBF1 (putative translation factor)
MSIKIGNSEYKDFSSMIADSCITQEEQDELKFRLELVGKLIEAREDKGLSQKELADLSGLKQPAIARLESMKATPQIDTLFKLLRPLGYTLAIVPDNHQTVK